MKKNIKQIIVLQIIVAIILVVGLFLISTYEKAETKELEVQLDFEHIWSLPIDEVYGSGDCVEVVEKIKAQCIENLNNIQYREQGKMSWYAAGLALGVYYVAQDCDNASEKMDELLDETWQAGDDYGQSDKLDDLTAAFRFIKNILN